MMSGLSLVKSFSEETYPKKLVLNFAYNPDKNSSDRIFRHDQPGYYISYREFRDAVVPVAKRNEIEHCFRQNNLFDYHVIMNGTFIELRFRNDHDSKLACSCLFPNETFDLEYLTYPETTEDDYLQKIAEYIQGMYDKTDLESVNLKQPVSLHANFEKHTIQVHVLGADIMRVMTHAEKFGQLLNGTTDSYTP